jgi:exodeoxyribonuclease-3
MTEFLGNGWVDTFRHLNPDVTGGYSWWSQRFPSVRLQNKGWRIDYICVTDSLGTALKNASIFQDVKHSDHCPIFIELSL